MSRSLHHWFGAGGVLTILIGMFVSPVIPFIVVLLLGVYILVFRDWQSENYPFRPYPRASRQFYAVAGIGFALIGAFGLLVVGTA